MADKGCQSASLAFMQAAAALGIRLAFSSHNNPKGNADTERFIRTLKEGLAWLREWSFQTSLIAALEPWIRHYNSAYLYSCLGYTPPETFEKNYFTNLSRNTLLKTPAKSGAVHPPLDFSQECRASLASLNAVAGAGRLLKEQGHGGFGTDPGGSQGR